MRRRRKKNKRKTLIIIASVCLLLVMTVGYAAFSTNLNITAKGNILEQDRVIQSWTDTSKEDFHSDYYKENIVSVTFLDNNNVPDKATESWNVSEDKNKGGVMAWVVPSTEDSTKYDLYIGANGEVIANENSGYLFWHFTEIKTINFNNNFDTSKATNMNRMFAYCINLIALDLSGFETSNVTDMQYMFTGDISLTSLNVNSFNTSNVTNMTAMFSMWHSTADETGGKLTTIDLSNFDTSKVTEMRDMFAFNENLISLNLCSFDTTNAVNMITMFLKTPNLKVIYVGSKWVTAGANTTNMFEGSGISEVTTGQC